MFSLDLFQLVSFVKLYSKSPQLKPPVICSSGCQKKWGLLSVLPFKIGFMNVLVVHVAATATEAAAVALAVAVVLVVCLLLLPLLPLLLLLLSVLLLPVASVPG